MCGGRTLRSYDGCCSVYAISIISTRVFLVVLLAFFFVLFFLVIVLVICVIFITIIDLRSFQLCITLFVIYGMW